MTLHLFAGLDGEMTGSGSREPGIIASKKYRLIQVGLAMVDMSANGTMLSQTLKLFSSDIGYDTWNSQPQAMAVNKFTPERIRAGPRPARVDGEACAWLDEHVGVGKRGLHAVGFNIGSFDMPFIREYLPSLSDRFSYRSVDLNSIIFSATDTDKEYRKLKRRVKDEAATTLRERGIQDNYHDAGYDAANALMAFKLLREKVLPEVFA